MAGSSQIPAVGEGSPVQGPSHGVDFDNLDCPPRAFHTSLNALISPPPRLLQCDHGTSGASPTITLPTTSTSTYPAAIAKPSLDPASHVVTVAVDHGSPTKQRSSPLRHSLSYAEPPESSPTTPDRSSISCSSGAGIGAIFDFSPTKRRNKMSFTGDSRTPGQNPRNRTPTWRGTSTDGGSSQPASSRDTTPTQQAKSGGGGGNSQTTTPKTSSPTASSRFAFFASSLTALKGGRSVSNPIAVPQDDELMQMDIEGALYPAGAQGNGDTFSPAAYKNLQMTATGLLHRFQSAYQQRTIEYQELKAERGAQNEEKDEVETRMHHLRIQLEDMASKAAEQEAAMQSLLEELAMEKKLRVEERQARERSVLGSDELTPSEDLGVEEDQNRRQWRRSVCTSKSDMSFETDEESVEGASVFSRSRSPTIATTMTELSSVDTPPLPQIKTPTSPTPRPTTRNTQPQMNTFQKLFKGIAGDASAEPRGASSCRNCSGQDASVAWDTVTLLKDENKGLKERVGELETAVEGALDVVNGLGTKHILV